MMRSKIVKLILVNGGALFLLLLFSQFSEAEGIKSYCPIKITGAPRIDGVLDEPCWKQAEKVTGFISLYGKKPAVQQTSVMVCYDEKNLYFGVECLESNITQLVKTFTKHDDPIWTDDCVEIFIAPDYYKRDNNYYHFIVNTLGTQHEGKYERVVKADYNPVRWNAPWHAKTTVAKDRWFAEVAIPFSSLEIEPDEEKELFGISICRERWAGETEKSYWPIGGSFHQPDGHLLFSSYKIYLKKKVSPLWEKEKEKEKEEIRKFSKPNLKIGKQFQEELEELIKPVELAKEELTKKESITPEELNSFLEKTQESTRKMQNLKPEIKFTLFLSRLKGLFE